MTSTIKTTTTTAIALIIAMAITLTTPLSALILGPGDRQMGDVTNDGNISIDDILAMRDHVFGEITLEGDDFIAADLYPDGTITIQDILLCRDIIFGLIPSIDWPYDVSGATPTTTINDQTPVSTEAATDVPTEEPTHTPVPVSEIPLYHELIKALFENSKMEEILPKYTYATIVKNEDYCKYAFTEFPGLTFWFDNELRGTDNFDLFMIEGPVSAIFPQFIGLSVDDLPSRDPAQGPYSHSFDDTKYGNAIGYFIDISVDGFISASDVVDVYNRLIA